MMKIRLLVLAAALSAGSAAAEDGASCDERLANASAQYRDAFYQSAPQYRDDAATTAALQAFRTIWNDIIDRWDNGAPCLRGPGADAGQRIRGIGDIAAKASAEIEHGRFDQAHLTLLQIRPMLAELRHANTVEDYSDHVDSFDDKLSETTDDDLDDNEISPDQFVQLCEQVGVLGYLAEKLEKRAPSRWAADADFLDALESLSRQVRGLKVAVLRGQSAPIHAALSDLRRSFDHFYLLYG